MVRLLWLLLLGPIIMVLGLLYQWVGSRYDRRRFLRLGRLVDIGERRRQENTREVKGRKEKKSVFEEIKGEQTTVVTNEKQLNIKNFRLFSLPPFAICHRLSMVESPE